MQEQAKTSTKNGKVFTTDEMFFNSVTKRSGQICEFCLQLPNAWRCGIFAANRTTVGQIPTRAPEKTELCMFPQPKGTTTKTHPLGPPVPSLLFCYRKFIGVLKSPRSPLLFFPVVLKQLSRSPLLFFLQSTSQFTSVPLFVLTKT